MDTSEVSASAPDFGLPPTATNWKIRLLRGSSSVRAWEVFNLFVKLDIFIDDKEVLEIFQHGALIQKLLSQPPIFLAELESIAEDSDEEDW